jgi:hypothetical protein
MASFDGIRNGLLKPGAGQIMRQWSGQKRSQITVSDTLSREELEQHVRARAWKDEAFRQEFVTNPKAVLERDYAQFIPDGKLPSDLCIKVIEEEEQTLSFVLPPQCSDNQLSDLNSIDDGELTDVSGGTNMITRRLCPTVQISATCKAATKCCDLRAPKVRL